MEDKNGPQDGVDTIPVDNARKTSLSDFPEEILNQVIKNLPPAPLPTGTGLPLPEPVAAAKKAMFNLCLVSKLFWNITLPIMYTHMIITDHIQMASVLANLTVYKERRAWVRWFSMLADHSPSCWKRFTKEWRRARVDSLIPTINWLEMEHQNANQGAEMLGIVDEVKEHLDQLLRSVMYIPAGQYEDHFRFPWGQFEIHLCGVYHRLVQMVLHLQNNIEDILITTSGQYAPRLTPRALQYTAWQDFRRAPNWLFCGNVFPSLRSIRKQAVRGTSSQPVLPAPLRPEFMRSKKWEFYWDSGDWFHTGLPLQEVECWPSTTFYQQIDLQIFSHVVELGLYASLTHPAMLRTLLASCRNLKSFSYTTNVLRWKYLYGTPVTYHDATLQEAIDEVQDTLTRIRVGWHSWSDELVEEQEAAVERHRVDVSHFPNLESIDIDVHFRKVISLDENAATDEDAAAGDTDAA